MKASGILGGIGARRTRMRRWAGLAAAPPLDSRLTFAILPPILRLAPLRPETGEAACCCTLLARELAPSWIDRLRDPLESPPPPSLPLDFSFTPVKKMDRIDRFSKRVIKKGSGEGGRTKRSFRAFICLSVGVEYIIRIMGWLMSC